MSVHSLEDLRRNSVGFGSKQDSVVFTNGCFDLIHGGHIHLLSQASELGNYLIVGLNTDESVHRLKGKNRPILSEDDRSTILDALQMVDDVVLFGEDTPRKLIKEVAPDILVKGADYTEEEIVGSEFVRNQGGRVERIELMEGKGTSEIVNQIRNS